MTETKQCSKCKIFRLPHQIEEHNKNCNICLDQRKRYREKHKEEIKSKAKEYREKHKEEINIKQNLKIECPLCKCMIRKYALDRHQQSQKHQLKLANLNQPKIIRNGDDETGMLGMMINS